MEYDSFYERPPDRIVDEANRVLVGPVLIIYEKHQDGRLVCTKLSTYLSREKLKEYGLDKSNPVFHDVLDIYRKQSRKATTENLKLFDVYIQYIPHCVLSSVFDGNGIKSIRTCRLVPTFTGVPRIIKSMEVSSLGGEGIKFGVNIREQHWLVSIEPSDRNKWLQSF